MRKRTFVIFAAITLLVLGALTFGVGRMQVASAHVQTPVVQAQLLNQQGGPDPGETTGSVEDQSQDQHLPGGGHQVQGQADHQFEGTE